MVALALGSRIRNRVRLQYERMATNQAFMVETVKAIRTVKASAMEPRKEEGWGRKMADYSVSSFDAAQAGNYASNSVQMISRLTTVALLGLGALEVISGAMTVGALIAFNMLSQRVSQPVLRLAGMWQQLQQMRVSLKRLSDLMESPTEDAQSGITPSKPLSGRVEFDRVGFRYPNRERDALRDVSLSVEPGGVVGIVGSSGSGKSTLVALLQRFYIPSAGRILVDGHNLMGLRPAWLRRQVGVVLQDNELFNGTVLDNIALADPSMPFERVERAAPAGMRPRLHNQRAWPRLPVDGGRGRLAAVRWPAPADSNCPGACLRPAPAYIGRGDQRAGLRVGRGVQVQPSVDLRGAHGLHRHAQPQHALALRPGHRGRERDGCREGNQGRA